MTCKEKLIAEHPELTEEGIDYVIKERHCPSDYGYLDEPRYCVVEHSTCVKCWDREIPETTDTVCLDPKDTTEKEKEDMPITRKTEAELVEEINALKKDLEEVKNVKQYEEWAIQIKAVHSALMNAGFTDTQAFELILTMIQTNSSIDLSTGATRARKF